MISQFNPSYSENFCIRRRIKMLVIKEPAIMWISLGLD
jgi:hypothetical protein